ncbi:winged helix-turn-helix domain-containing protein [Pseudomonas citronellolis]|uniref:ATP-binding protein n=1 Tax=Pseudomonas citronellolis TaxID=53408 RepID=UPI00248F02A8|nr:winged helix-turn-helix domain-containing protein [Pseudomonas citronellolis]
MESVTDALHDSFDPSLEFGPFRVTPGKRLLSRDGEPVEIGGRALDLLIALLEKPGQVLSKRELIKRVWPDVVVEEGSLRFHMNSLRRALGDGEQGARYIATQVGVGYAFVAPVSRRPALDVAPSAAPVAPLGESVGGLPPRARLFGREADVALVLERLAQPRLFTIVGTGGVGKTSLAVEVGHRAAGERLEPVRFVDLAQVEDAVLVPSALAASLGIPVQVEDPLFVLLAHLRGQRLLLIIDNCEHLVDAVSAVAERIGEAAPGVALLATSREPLRVRGEQVHWLGPLGFPADSEGLSLEQLLAFPAVRLFVERAKAGNASLALEEGDAQLVADMCRRLDGMALPIELAAMRAASHGVKATHALLGERFSLGWAGWRTAQPRHQTLRAMLDWSYDLLSAPQRLVFDRLAVFVGPFSLQAASQIVADARIDELEAAATLDELAAKGLVTVDRSETTVTYRLLEMTRAYVRDKLPAHGAAEMHSLGFRHALFYLKLLEGLGSSPEDIFDGCARLASQLGNIRSALEWSFGPQGDPGLALPLAAASAPLFLHFSLQVECRTWCARATELLELGYHGTPTEMELQAALGLVLMFTRGNSGAAETALLRALDIAVALDDRWAQLRLLGRLQIFYERIGDFASSLAWAERALAIGDSLGEPEAIAVAASLAGISHHLLGDQRLARQELERSLRNSLPSERSRTLHYGFDHHNRTGLALARTLWLLGFPDQARRLATQVEAEAAELKHPATYCIALVWTLCIHIWNGDLAQAEASLQAFSQIAHANAFAPYVAASLGLRGAIAIRREQPGDAVPLLEESLSRLQGMRYELLTTSFEISLAEGLILDGQYARALAVIQRSVQHCRRSGDAFALPELLRLQAQVLKALGEGAAAVDAVLDESLALARQQGARAWELRAGMDRAKLHLEQGRNAEAAQLIDACALSEGFDSLDMRQLAQLRQRLG